ncbi:MAG: glutamine synthetase family protein [bacterium]|nr:glutamine synthetase family protein [bacterium]
MTKAETIRRLQELEVRYIKFGVFDIDGVLRGKLISKEKFLSALDSDVGFCNVIFGWDINDQCYDNTKVSGWHTGYPDAFASIDPETFRTIPWQHHTPFFLADFESALETNQVCPRSLLKRIRNEAIEMGFLPKFSAEFEWFNFAETPQSFHEKGYQNPTPLTPGMFGYSVLRFSQQFEYVDQLFNQLHSFGIPLEGLHTETGDGVYEAAITYDDILIAADRAALFKTAVKEIAAAHEIMPSFMAKWNPELPGCSGHIHQSLWDEHGSNLFFDEHQPDRISKLMQHFVAGQLHCLPHILPMFAPTTNSYKRYVEGSWSPTSVSWGVENRTTALRVINHKEQSMRVEYRVSGADVNPYLSMAAALASGLFGIKNELELTIPSTNGNQYAVKDSVQLPDSLEKATKAMKNSDIANQLFGDEFVDHFIRTREWEVRQQDLSQPNWEMKRYFEII